jgi:hypothetical protein
MTEEQEHNKLRARELARIDSPIVVVAHPDSDDATYMHLYVHDPEGTPLFVGVEPGGYGLHLCDAVCRWLGEPVKIVMRLWPDVPKGYP